jgi:hypothetical protein
MCHTLRRLWQQRWSWTAVGRIKIALTRFSSIGVGEARKFRLNLPRRMVVSIVSQRRILWLESGEPMMRMLSLTVTALAALFLALAPPAAIAQQPQQPQQQQQPQLAPPKAYKPVPVKLPQPVADATFATFRQQLAGIAEKKDRAALARIIAQSFFWIPEGKDIAEKGKPPVDNLSKAIGLEGQDPPGWDLLAGFAGEPTAEPINDPGHAGVICSPAEPTLDDKAFEELVTSTQTDPAEWGYPTKDGIEARAQAQANSPVVEKLGLNLVRAYPDESPAGAVNADMIRIVTPSGKLAFIPTDALLPLASDQVCYIKEGTTWKIAGVIGGVPPAR